jgi:hypothetical protein
MFGGGKKLELIFQVQHLGKDTWNAVQRGRVTAALSGRFGGFHPAGSRPSWP